MAIAPPPRAIASDPTPIALVKGKHSGEIESLDRHPKNCYSQPGNAISWDFTSLLVITDKKQHLPDT